MKFILIVLFCIVVFIMSAISLVLYMLDKARAKKGVWRIPEAVLLGVGFLGGAAGSLLAMKKIRHKTKHWYFWVVNILGILWQVALVVVMIIVL